MTRRSCDWLHSSSQGPAVWNRPAFELSDSVLRYNGRRNDPSIQLAFLPRPTVCQSSCIVKVWHATAGLAVGCIAPIKGLLFGADPPLGFLTQSLDTMAGAMIPSMMLVLGSVLHKGPGSAKLPVKTIVGVLAARQILIPMLGQCSAPHHHRYRHHDQHCHVIQ